MQGLHPAQWVDPDAFGDTPEFRWLLEKLPIAAYVCDADGLITYFNSRAAEVWGREPKLNDPAERFCGSARLFATDGSPVSHDECWMALALRDGVDYNGHEIVIERPDGTRLTGLAHVNALRDEAGRVRGAVNVVVDITDRKRTDLDHALLAAIVASSDDAIVSKTLDGVIRSWNAGAQRIFGYSPEEAVGQPITLIIPPELIAEEREILGRLRRGERIDHFETIRVTKDGRRIDISLTVSPVRDSSGRIVGASKVGRDITAQELAEKALRESDRRKSEFLALLAHELRSPLAPLRNSLQIVRLARGTGTGHAAVEEAHAVMGASWAHLVRLVDDLLDLSRITKGKIELRRERIDLASAVPTRSRPAGGGRGGWARTGGHAAGRRDLGDGDRTPSQVFANLLNNSARYTEHGGRIALKVERRGANAVVTVADNGVGIPRGTPRIFEMFTQADRRLERRRGLGIGLNLVRGLVELHGAPSRPGATARAGAASSSSASRPSPHPHPKADRPTRTRMPAAVPPSAFSSWTTTRILPTASRRCSN